MEEDLLDSFLLAANEELENNVEQKQSLKDIDIFAKESNSLQNVTDDGLRNTIGISYTDSSDDENSRNCEKDTYKGYGKEIQCLLQSTTSPTNNKIKSRFWKQKTSLTSNNIGSKVEYETSGLAQSKSKFDVYTDPIFGIRIVNPLVSSTVLQERMVGRDAIPFARINHYLQFNKNNKDWVIAGVVVNKSAARTSQKGSQFIIWTLSDLKGDIKTVSLFLFAGAYKNLWKTVVGTVVGVLNPNVLDKKSGSKDEASLSIDNPQKVMVLGQSKDFGICKSLKKNGEQCTAIVNLNQCQFCVYHIKQEYQKCSKRSELQSNFTGKGLVALRNKVLGKNEVFYAGKSYTAIPAKRSKKLEQKDENRLQSLSGIGIKVNRNVETLPKKKNLIKKQNAARFDVSQAQRLKDIELLKRLGGPTDIESKNIFTGESSAKVTLEESKNQALSVISRLKKKNNDASLINTKGQCDLMSKIYGKAEFNSKSSEIVTSDKAKCTAANIQVNKLDSKNSQHEISNSSQIEMKQSENDLMNNTNDDEMDLSYSVDVSSHNDKNEHLDINTNLNSQSDHSMNRSVLPITNKDRKITKTNSSKECILQITSNDNKTNSNDLSNQLRSLNKPLLNSIVDFPVLSGFGMDSTIDLNQPPVRKCTERAKLNAIKFIQKTGALKKEDPNRVKNFAKKRPIENTDLQYPAKKSKLQESEFISDRFKKMMAATSKHVDLLESKDEEEQIKYFQKLELKEKMEDKMANTYKVPCKAVKCLKCKYTNFSASEMCKNEKHPLKVYDAVKRFFKCGNCGNRTASLEIIPTLLCKNCGSGKWERTGMMKEKIVSVSHSLSIRGGEQKFINSLVTDANINLLVPDTGN